MVETLNNQEGKMPNLPIGKDVMDKLKSLIGKEVILSVSEYGNINSSRERLDGVCDFVNIDTEKAGIPFVGYDWGGSYGLAIKEILSADGQVIYSNPLITAEYSSGKVSNRQINRISRLTFGNEVINHKIKEWNRLKRNEERRNKTADEKAQIEAPRLIEKGKKLIENPVLKEKWTKGLDGKIKNSLAFHKVTIVVSVGESLRQGVPFDEITKSNDVRGDTVKIIGAFMPDGNEFKKWWNAKTEKELAKAEKEVADESNIKP